MKKLMIITVLIFASLNSYANEETDLVANIEKGKAATTSCMGCHGPRGLSMIPGTPHLRGQQAAYLKTQLKSFRDGKRVDENKIMVAMTQALSDQDIENIAAYYESLTN